MTWWYKSDSAALFLSVCGHGREFPSSLLTSIKIFLQAFLAARGRQARASSAAAIVHRPHRDHYGGSDDACFPRTVDLIWSRDPRAKRANVKTCLLRFYFGYCSSLPPPSSLPFRAPLPSSPLLRPSLVSPPQKAIINLHFITQLQEEKEAKEADSTTSR